MKWAFQKMPISSLQGGSNAFLEVLYLYPNKATFTKFTSQVKAMGDH
jgi:hypothetical protein